MGDDGRRYLFDLYRLNPVDIEFLEKECEPKEEDDMPTYPHKLTLLRPELIESFWDYKFRLWLQEKANQKQNVYIHYFYFIKKNINKKKKNENNNLLNNDNNKFPI